MSNPLVAAKREMASEKKAGSRKRGNSPTELERAAEKTRRSRHIKKKVESTQESAGGAIPSPAQADFEKAARSAASEGLSWSQYKPGVEDGIPEHKTISLNPATIRSIAKKLIAREWRRALGKPRRDTRGEQLEREAGNWREKKELERKLKEEEQLKLVRYASDFNQALNEFSLDLIEGRWGERPNDAESAFREQMETLGELYKIEWAESGCRLWYEPWREIRGRRKSAAPVPVIYTCVIDAGMNITTFSKNEDENFLPELREEELARSFEMLQGEEQNGDDTLEDILEEAVSGLGRIAAFSKTSSGWVASIEPWEEMRMRKRKRIKQASAALKEIAIAENAGKLTFRINADQNKP